MKVGLLLALGFSEWQPNNTGKKAQTGLSLATGCALSLGVPRTSLLAFHPHCAEPDSKECVLRSLQTPVQPLSAGLTAKPLVLPSTACD